MLAARPRAGRERVYTILNIVKVKAEHLDAFIEHVRRHAVNSLREAGCVRYDVLQDEADPTTVCLYGVFRAPADLDVHRAQDYYKEWMTRSRDWRDPSQSRRLVLRNLGVRS